MSKIDVIKAIDIILPPKRHAVHMLRQLELL